MITCQRSAIILSAVSAALLGVLAFSAAAQNNLVPKPRPTPTVAAPQTLAAGLARDAHYGTLLTAWQAAGLTQKMRDEGPFTVFAPVDAAFTSLPEGAVRILLQPENRRTLTGLLLAQVVPGRFTAGQLLAAVRAGGGQKVLRTLAGTPLTVELSNTGQLLVTDASGNVARLTPSPARFTNGVVFATDRVLMPR